MGRLNKQEMWVIERLVEDGHVDNVNAFHHFILRLSSIILRLRRKGWLIQTDTTRSNTVYKLIARP